MREMQVSLQYTSFIIKTKSLFCNNGCEKLVEFCVILPLLTSQLPYFSSVLFELQILFHKLFHRVGGVDQQRPSSFKVVCLSESLRPICAIFNV